MGSGTRRAAHGVPSRSRRTAPVTTSLKGFSAFTISGGKARGQRETPVPQLSAGHHLYPDAGP
jgi:hypothetical protein